MPRIKTAKEIKAEISGISRHTCVGVSFHFITMVDGDHAGLSSCIIVSHLSDGAGKRESYVSLDSFYGLPVRSGWLAWASNTLLPLYGGETITWHSFISDVISLKTLANPEGNLFRKILTDYLLGKGNIDVSKIGSRSLPSDDLDEEFFDVRTHVVVPSRLCIPPHSLFTKGTFEVEVTQDFVSLGRGFIDADHNDIKALKANKRKQGARGSTEKRIDLDKFRKRVFDMLSEESREAERASAENTNVTRGGITPHGHLGTALWDRQCVPLRLYKDLLMSSFAEFKDTIINPRAATSTITEKLTRSADPLQYSMNVNGLVIAEAMYHTATKRYKSLDDVAIPLRPPPIRKSTPKKRAASQALADDKDDVPLSEIQKAEARKTPSKKARVEETEQAAEKVKKTPAKADKPKAQGSKPSSAGSKTEKPRGAAKTEPKEPKKRQAAKKAEAKKEEESTGGGVWGLLNLFRAASS